MVVTGLELAVTAVVVAGLRVLPAIVTGVVVAMVMTVVMVVLTCMVRWWWPGGSSAPLLACTAPAVPSAIAIAAPSPASLCPLPIFISDTPWWGSVENGEVMVEFSTGHWS